jgi:hypothetical protein
MITKEKAIEELDQAIAMAGNLKSQMGPRNAEKLVEHLNMVRQFIDPALSPRPFNSAPGTAAPQTHEPGTDLAAPDSPRRD